MNELILTVQLSLDAENHEDAYIDFILSVDGQYLHEDGGAYIDPAALVASAGAPGEHYIFTCNCGNPACLGIDEGVTVTHTATEVQWKLRQPIAWPAEESLPDWTQDVTMVFDKESYVEAVDRALLHAKTLARGWSGEGMLWLGPALSFEELLALEIPDSAMISMPVGNGTIQ